jgi:hypothetical protein
MLVEDSEQFGLPVSTHEPLILCDNGVLLEMGSFM